MTFEEAAAITMPQTNTDAALESLAAHWLEAKQAERTANIQRIAIEEAIIEITGQKEEGRFTLPLASGMKLTVIGKLTYKGDTEEIEALTMGWPEQFQIIKHKMELDEPRIRKIREMRPDLWRTLAQHITTRAAKTGITIEPAEEA
jgi:hypothetical protein